MTLKTGLPLIRVSWFSINVISSIWFLYWICYEALMWNKVLTQATPVNYIAFVLSITLLIIGTQLEKIGYFDKTKLFTEQNQVQQLQQIQDKEQTKQIQRIEDGKNHKPINAKIPSGCSFYLGYLKKRLKSVPVPAACLVCGQMMNCLLNEKQTIQNR